jgi:hypothetical protein
MESTSLIEKSDMYKAYHNRMIAENDRKEKANERKLMFKKSMDNLLNQSFEDDFYNSIVSEIKRCIKHNMIRDTNIIETSKIRRFRYDYGVFRSDKISTNIVNRLHEEFSDINVTKIRFDVTGTDCVPWYAINCFVCCIPECILQYKKGSMYRIRCTIRFDVNFGNVDTINESN